MPKITPNKVTTERKVMASVGLMFDFTRTQVESMLHEANSKGLVELDQKNLEAVVNLVSASIRESFVRSSGEVITVLKALDK
jgi:hypothetical protein